MTDLHTLALAAQVDADWWEANEFTKVIGSHDAAFIAAASPAVVLALLDVVEAARDCVGVLPLPLRVAGDGHPIIDTLTAHSAEVDALRAALAAAKEATDGTV